MREETHFATCERPTNGERPSHSERHPGEQTHAYSLYDRIPPRSLYLERRLRAPAFERSHYEFTKNEPSRESAWQNLGQESG